MRKALPTPDLGCWICGLIRGIRRSAAAAIAPLAGCNICAPLFHSCGMFAFKPFDFGAVFGLLPRDGCLALALGLFKGVLRGFVVGQLPRCKFRLFAVEFLALGEFCRGLFGGHAL